MSRFHPEATEVQSVMDLDIHVTRLLLYTIVDLGTIIVTRVGADP